MQLKTDQWNLIGARCHEKAQFNAAIHNFRKALKIDPNRHDIRANLADNLRRIWEFDEALVELNHACIHGMFDKPATAAARPCWWQAAGRKALSSGKRAWK